MRSVDPHRQERWEAAAFAFNRPVDRNVLPVYMAVADSEQQAAVRDTWKRAYLILLALNEECSRPEPCLTCTGRKDVAETFREKAGIHREDTTP